MHIYLKHTFEVQRLSRSLGPRGDGTRSVIDVSRRSRESCHITDLINIINILIATITINRIQHIVICQVRFAQPDRRKGFSANPGSQSMRSKRSRAFSGGPHTHITYTVYMHIHNSHTHHRFAQPALRPSSQAEY